MSTFIGQLVGFAVIVFLLWKYVVPPVRTMMKNQQETVRTQLSDHAEAEKKVADADKEHAKALEEAKAEAAKVIEEARHDAEKIAEQLRAHADSELERIKIQGGQQVQLLRQQLIRELRQSLGAESVHRAGDLVRDFVSDPAEQSATVDRFLDELDEMAPSSTTFDDAATAKLRAASRASVAELVKGFDGVAADLDSDGLTKLADDLASAVKLLRREPVLARHLADPSSDSAAKVQLVDATAVRQGFRFRAGHTQNRCIAALVVHLRPDPRRPAHRQAGAAGARRERGPDRGRRGPAVQVQPHP